VGEKLKVHHRLLRYGPSPDLRGAVRPHPGTLNRPHHLAIVDPGDVPIVEADQYPPPNQHRRRRQRSRAARDSPRFVLESVDAVAFLLELVAVLVGYGQAARGLLESSWGRVKGSTVATAQSALGTRTALVTVENRDPGVSDLQVVARVAPCVSSLSFIYQRKPNGTRESRTLNGAHCAD
jgi:hypothetical protein